jgi:nucleoside-diphosphate-sugar epimerase
MRILLTGATGFIGSAVARALLRRGHSVVGLVRDPARGQTLKQHGVELAVGDMWRPDTYRPLVKGVDAVVHTAQQKTGGRWSRRAITQMHESDALMTCALADECLAHGRRLVYTSGGLNYAGHADDIWLDETTPPSPCLLAKGHADMEAELKRRAGLDFVIVTPGLVYGAGGLLADMVPLLLKGQYRVAGRGDNLWSLVHVDDLAELFVLVLDKAPAGANYFAADDEPIARRAFVERVASAIGARRPGWIPMWLLGLLYGWALVEAIGANMRLRNSRAGTWLAATLSYAGPGAAGGSGGAVESGRLVAMRLSLTGDRLMVTLPLDCSDDDILDFARRWTDRLVAEDYSGAFDMLLHVKTSPGKSWVDSPERIRSWIVNYYRGFDGTIEGEPDGRVTPIESATGKPWRYLPSLNRSTRERYPGRRGRLDWELPLNGEWSDLVASFDLVEHDGELAFVLVSLRVP